MKKFIFFGLSLMLALNINAQIPESNLTSKVKEVIVFRRGIQETRTGTASIPSGNSVIKLTGLATDINPNSIQVKGVENFTVLSISYRINYLTTEDDSPEVKQIADSINLLSDKQSYISKKIYVLNQEKSLFTDNRNMIGKDVGIDAEELEEMVMLYGKRLIEIENELSDYQNQETQNNNRLSRLNSQLKTFTRNKNKGVGEILIDVKSDNKVNSLLVVSYYLNSGGWYPFYDVRAKDTKSDVEIAYKANVFQSSGEDWDNVKMKLSSGTPNFSNDLPELYTWQLTYGYIYNQKNNNYGYNGKSGKGTGGTYSWDYGDGTVTDVNGNSTTKQSAGYEFNIAKPYSIPTDGKEYVVEIGKSSVATSFSYFAVPKMDEAAFILARLTGWYELNLLPGKTNIYLGNSYVGETYLNPDIVEDTLDISLGNDESIIVKRRDVSDMNSKSLTGNTRKRTDEWELSFRNNHSYPVKIKVLDQIPISTDKDITVSADNYDGANYIKESGELSWILEVAPSESKNVRFKYTVKYPKNKIITNF